MIPKIIGVFSIFWGLLWFVRPEFLRGRLLVKAHRYLFWTVLITLVYPLVHFYGKAFGMGMTAAVVIGFWVVMGRLKNKMSEAFQVVPLIAFRAAGAVNIGAGCALLWWPKS